MKNPKSKIQNPKILKIFIFLFVFITLQASSSKLQALFAQENQTAPAQELEQKEAIGGRVTLDFKDADIHNVLKIISYKSGVNIVTTPDVMGTVTISLKDVPWEKALDVILKTYGYGYERIGNIITVAPIDILTEQKKKEVELAEVQPTLTEVFNLKYLDANDAKKALEPLLSSRGKITVLEMTGQSGWEFGAAELAKRKRVTEEKMGRSKTLIVSDVPPALDKIREIVAQIDIKPQQIAIEARIMEVNHDLLRDIGFDFGTSSGGASTDTITGTPVSKSGSTTAATVGGHILGSQNDPSIFVPKQTDISGSEPFDTGLQLVFQKLSGTQFEAMVHALEEDIHTNTLSCPRIMALNNQEAAILVGTKYPILKTEESTQTTSQYTVSKSLDYYQDVGIQLNVVPQISGKDHINMVIHPAVTSTSTGVGSTATTYYPIITTREAETRVIMKDGETVVIAGLLKDVVSTEVTGIPFVKDLPLIGPLFRRDTKDIEKIDLLIFITAHIVKEGEFTPEKIEQLKENLGKETQPVVKKKDKKKKK